VIYKEAEVDGERREAAFSEDLKYRYSLTICWNPSQPTLTAIGLNPSTADHLKDDATLKRCKAFARSFECGSFQMLNCFALRSTDYKALFRAEDPVGPENTLEFLHDMCDGTFVIACWGAHITERGWRHIYRGRDIAKEIPDLHALQVTKSGHPSHPLYLSSLLRPVPFAYAD
jgi:hypothetical protein